MGAYLIGFDRNDLKALNLIGKIVLDRTEWKHKIHEVNPKSLGLRVDDDHDDDLIGS